MHLSAIAEKLLGTRPSGAQTAAATGAGIIAALPAPTPEAMLAKYGAIALITLGATIAEAVRDRRTRKAIEANKPTQEQAEALRRYLDKMLLGGDI